MSGGWSWRTKRFKGDSLGIMGLFGGGRLGGGHSLGGREPFNCGALRGLEWFGGGGLGGLRLFGAVALEEEALLEVDHFQ